MTRQRAFEASHRYWVAAWSEEENARRFGRTSGRFGHGHNYVVWATVEGPVDVESGMFMNLVDLDAALAEVVDRMDHRFLNEECQDLLGGRQPSTEVLASVVWEGMQARLASYAPLGVALHAVRLAETPELFAEAERGQLPMIRLTRGYTFSAAHRLARTDLTAEENRRVYGKCANPHGHGHDYRLEVSVAGEPDETTGLVVDLVELDRAIQEEILDPWDHRHLNAEVEPFDRVIPTSENVVRIAWERLRPRLGDKLDRLALYETPRGWFEYRGGA